MPGSSKSPRAVTLRTTYEAAYAQTLRQRKNSEGNDGILALENAAVNYASTAEGRERITADAQRQDAAGDLNLSIMLEKAVQRGAEKGKARTEISKTTRQDNHAKDGDTRSSSDSGPPEPLLWTPDNPVWPKRAVIDDALTITHLPKEALKQGWEAYQVLYRHAWRTMFPKTDTGWGQLESNKAGWEGRANAAIRVQEWLKGAELVQVKNFAPEMVVCNGYKVRRVASLNPEGRTNLVRDTGKTKRIEVFTIVYEEGRSDTKIPGDQTMVRLPFFESS